MDSADISEGQQQSFSNPPERENLALPGIYAMPEEIAMLFIDASALIEKVKHNLAGEILVARKDERGNIVTLWSQDGERKMNDKGIRYIVSLLDAFVGTHTATSTLSLQEIYDITLDVVEALNEVLRSKGNEFEIDRNYKSTLITTIGRMVFIQLHKSLEGATLKALTQSYQVRELKGIGQEKKGFSLGDLSPLNLINRGGNR
jgi:hypothetical protein